jgi:hypothetical protein
MMAAECGLLAKNVPHLTNSWVVAARFGRLRDRFDLAAGTEIIP